MNIVFFLLQNPRSNSKESGGKLQITWDNPKELEVYITKLQSAAEKLSTENRKLRKWHTDFIDKVQLDCIISCLFIMNSFVFGALLSLMAYILGSDTDECRSTEASAAMEGWPSGPSYRLCYFGGSGIDYVFGINCFEYIAIEFNLI